MEIFLYCFYYYDVNVVVFFFQREFWRVVYNCEMYVLVYCGIVDMNYEDSCFFIDKGNLYLK